MEEIPGIGQVKQEFVSCTICGTSTTKVLYQFDMSAHLPPSHGSVDLDPFVKVVKCNTCGLVYVTPRWIFSDGTMPYTEDEEEKYFDSTYAERKNAYTELVSRLPGWINRPVTRALDIGCGDGVLLEVCQQSGITCEGLEVSKSLVDKLKERFQDLPIHYNGLEQLPSAQYDVVFLINVIEHLADPAETIRHIYRVLRPGGITLIHTPNMGGIPALLKGARWHQIAPLVHLYYFTPKTLEKLLSEENLSSIDWFYLASLLPRKRYLQLAEYKLGLHLDNGLGIVAYRPVG